MTELGLWLSGASFVLALLALTLAVAEHRRADRVEKVLLASLENHQLLIPQLTEGLAGVTQSNANAWRELKAQDAMIRAVAAASQPVAFPHDQSKVYISVPGPTTLQ